MAARAVPTTYVLDEQGRVAGMTLARAATGRPFATKYAHSLFGQDRSTVDVA